MPMPSKSLFLLALLLACSLAQAAPTVFPTGTTLYQPDKTWNGFTVLSILDMQAVVVIDMNGRVVKRWEGFNVSAGGPARILPGGHVLAPTGANPPHQEALALVQQDFDGKELWRYDHNEEITLQDGTMVWSTRQHHDWQRPDFPAGYYAPGVQPALGGTNTLLLTHTNHSVPAVADVTLEDDRLIEIAADGTLLWEWRAADHVDEFRFDEEERAAIKSAPGVNPARGNFDWLHINSAHYVGPNQWFDAGDERFAPDNVIVSSRQSSIVAIIARDGSLAWQIGPDFSRSPEERAIGQVIGQHHAHLIPQGLPGAGNMLIFDNGGSSGYGTPSPIGPNGQGLYARATSRVIEINPVTLERVWTYTAPNFFSTNISSAQRLPNGNTLITEGAPGRVFEVTAEGTIVWEYMNAPTPTGRRSNSVYRAYRVPYEWLPQLAVPEETPVTPRPDVASDEAAIATLLDGLETIFAAGDVDAAVTAFTDDAIILSENGADIVGADAIRATYTSMLRQFDVELAFMTDEIEIAGDLAFERGTYLLKLTDKASGQVVNDAVSRHIHVLKRQIDGSWKTWRMMVNSLAAPAP